MINSAELLKNTPCTCIDGRTLGDRISIPGGSFAIIFTVLKDALDSGSLLLKTETEFNNALLKTSELLAPIYYHSDQKNHDLTLKQCGIQDNELRSYVSDNLEAYSTSYLNNMGCGHLNLISQSLSSEGSDLLKSLTKAFWQGWVNETSGFIYDCLLGSHEEEKVIIYNSSVNAYSKYEKRDGQNFAYHPKVESDFIEEFSKFAFENKFISKHPDTTAIQSIVDTQNNNTVQALASDLEVETI
jgi:hypothetical protein